ncbi:transcriptional regulator family: Fungal Specific TF [Penicillium angulare]|uniref:transcriptional regulator family: Fungal Specific TF n=1 Tax=Penicillium angulare TaxID=116970 RepID=UPI0025408395|nr:transcriptional regulator family: Fungal Specific TF [Penicillium angulare]KAJ5266923.1 transcriptional regulator family: Fungal Specific TF [Penicillium angulare]
MGPPSQSGPELTSELQNKIRDFGYSNHDIHNSGSLLRTTDLYSSQESTFVGSPTETRPIFQGDANRKYKEFVRRLPSWVCIDTLVHTFFSNINWQYDLLDEEHFREQLSAWGKLSYSDLQEGFGILQLGTLVFPALLFQVLAQALLFHPPADEKINSLMTMADMTFQDLGSEYSDIGADLLILLGKTNITIDIVQAGLLRASFLKSSGTVVEAWHALGAAIRDAQEIGLHKGRIVSHHSAGETKSEKQRSSFVGHKVWTILHIWDVHMAVVLGRPIATDLQIDQFASTIQDKGSRQEIFSHWQTEIDPPRPFDIILAGYNVAYRYFKDIHQIENNGAHTQDYSVVEHIHSAIKKNLESLPSWCRLENPDTKFDRLHGCQWLPAAREGLSSLIHLVLLTLHRPFIFFVANSRTEALKAGISILRAQERLFEQSEPHQHKVFNSVYASFDAIVLIAALCLVFPNNHYELRAECIDVIENGMRRLGIIGQFNSMASSAHGVVYSLYHRLRHQPGIPGSIEDATAVPSNSKWTTPNSDMLTSNGEQSELALDVILPPRPTHDLFFDHVSSTQIPFVDTSDGILVDPLTANITENWDFEGAFSDSSFWSFMNDFNH